MVQLQFKNMRLTYNVRELVFVLTFLGGLAAHAIRTEIAYAGLKAELREVRKELDDCKQARNNGDARIVPITRR